MGIDVCRGGIIGVAKNLLQHLGGQPFLDGAAHDIAEGYLVNIRKSHETSRFGPYIR